MENQIIGNASEFCGCATDFRTVVLIPTADGGKATLDGEPYEEQPEFCNACGKRNPEPIHVTFDFGNDIKVNDGY